MRAAINASPLIFLARLDQLRLLQAYEEVLTTPEVVGKVLMEPLENYPESLRIKGALEVGFIKVVPAERSLERDFGLGSGELSVLVLARQERLEEVIVDDRAAIAVAKYLGLRVVSTPFLLLRERLSGRISIEEFERSLDGLLRANYYISPRLLEKIRRKASEARNG
ncbi:MAG: hypothetical protein ACE5HJ_09825 [Thermoplasmata archaeon]